MARPSPAVNETAHVADSQRSSDPLFKNKRSRRIAKGDGLRSIRLLALSQAERSVMRKHIEIDHKHSRAIVQKIGERLRTSLKPEPGVPARLRKQIDRLREMEEQSLEDAART
jgi:hypothetical protein